MFSSVVLPPPLEPFRSQNLPNLGKAPFDIVVDQDIVIAIPVADFRFSARHAFADHRIAILRAGVEAAFEFFD